MKSIPYRMVKDLMGLVLEDYRKDTLRHVDHTTNTILKLIDKLENR